MEVIKQNGSTEPFNIEKIKRSLLKAAIDADLTEVYTTAQMKQMLVNVYRWTKGRPNVTTGQIREFIMNSDERIADVWKKFDSRYKGNSQMTAGLFRKMEVGYNAKIADEGRNSL